MGSSSHLSKRKKKRSQKRSKKKIRSSREKTKKPKRRHDSVSCSEDVSASTSLVSCPRSEDDCRGRKRDRSRDRKDRKGRKKRTERSSSVSESSGGDDTPRVKKRKRSKRSKGSDSRKKQRAKNRRRDHSVSSSSGRSRSCSSREGRADSEREFGRNEAKERKRREKGKGMRGSKKSHRLRSRSPCSLHSESHSYENEERVTEEYYPKRLKSIIVATKVSEEAEIRESNGDEHKDEIVYEHDDYPSKSNDSNDGVSRREALSNSQDVSSEKQTLDDPNGKAVSKDVGTSEIPESQRLVAEETDAVASSNVGTGVDDNLKGNRNEASAAKADSNRDDLETILRQKALENLLKRQGKLLTRTPASKKGDLDGELKGSLSLKTDLAQHIPDEVEGIKSVQNLGKVDDVKYTTDAPGPPKGTDARLPSGELRIGHPAEKDKAPVNFVNSRTNVGLSTSGREFIGAKNTWRRQLVSEKSSQLNLSAPKETTTKDSKRQLTSEESSLPNLSEPREAVDNDSTRGIRASGSQLNLSAPIATIIKDSKRQLKSQESSLPNLLEPREAVAKDSIRVSGSPRLDTQVSTEKVDSVTALDPTSMRGQSTDENINEAGEGSQFQQKTMSVMRGGEMVQVSYKVYIPKKVPALARRQLKR